MQNPCHCETSDRCHWLWQSVPLWLCAGVLRMTLLRCPKFLRCLTADAGNFDRGHSLTSLPLPPAALGSLPTTRVRTGLGMTVYNGCAGVGADDSVRPRATARVAPTDGLQEVRRGTAPHCQSALPLHIFLNGLGFPLLGLRFRPLFLLQGLRGVQALLVPAAQDAV